METEGLDFGGALESLADRYGVELERETEDPAMAARRERTDRLRALLERTAAYYVRVLWESPEAEAPARISWGADSRRRRCASSASASPRAPTTACSRRLRGPATRTRSCWRAGSPRSAATAAG